MSLVKDGLGKIGLVNLEPLDSLIHAEITPSWYLGCWVLAVIWFLLRGHAILRRPKMDMIEALGMTEPVIPDVVIDSLGDTWVSIYWQYAPPISARSRRPKVRKHIIRVGGQIIEAERDSRRALITDLQPDTAYELTVQAVQSLQVESLVHAQSLGGPANSTPNGALNVVGSLSAPWDSQPVKTAQSSVQPAAASSSLGGIGAIHLQTLHSMHEAPPPVSTMLKADTPEFSESEQHQVSDVIAVQQEVREVTNQMAAVEAQYNMKYKTLIQELNDLNSHRKQDESSRTQLRIENKNLEDENHALEVQISKIKLQAAKIAKYQAESERSYHKAHEIEQQQQQKKSENESVLDDLEYQIKELQSQETAQLQAMREATQRFKLVETNTEGARVFVQKLKDESQFSSVESKLALLSSEDASYLDSSAIKELEHEIQLNHRIEVEWSRAQKSLEDQYVEAYLRNSELKAQASMGQPHLQQHQHQQHQHQHQQQQLQPQNDVGPMDQNGTPLSRLTPSPPASMNVSMGSASGNIPFLHPSQATQSAPGALGGAAAFSPLHLASQQSLGSLHTSSSLHSMAPSAMSAVQPLSSHGCDPFVAPSPQVTPIRVDQTPRAARLRTNIPFQLNQVPNGSISPTAAGSLLPSNLFQDNSSLFAASGSTRYSSDGSSSSPLSVLTGEEEGAAQENSGAEPSSNSKNRENSWLPWLSSPQSKSSSNRRTTSLFFGVHPDDESNEESEAISADATSDGEPDVSAGTEHNSINRSPLRNMGSRFFQKSQNKSGGFVRRLSIFSRRDSEHKLEEEPES